MKLFILLFLLIPIAAGYQVDKSSDIWHPVNASNWITPDNPTVNLIAKGLYLDDLGQLRYKHLQVIQCWDCWGKEWWVDFTFQNNYVYDMNAYGEDYWLMPEAYLKNGFKGDCEDWAVTVASIMLSGNLTYHNQPITIPAKVVSGYLGDQRDTWVQYPFNNQTYVSTTASISGISSTIYQPLDSQFKPLIHIN